MTNKIPPLHSFTLLLSHIKEIKEHFMGHLENEDFKPVFQDFDDIVMSKIELKNTIAVIEKLMFLWAEKNKF